LQLRNGSSDSVKRGIILSKVVAAANGLPVGDEALDKVMLPAAHGDARRELEQRLRTVRLEALSTQLRGSKGSELLGA
jgi:hypothetical protein